MAQEEVPLKGLFGGDMHVGDHEGMHDTGGSSSTAVQQRKKASRSPLRARQQQSSNIMDLDNTRPGSMKSDMTMKSRSGSPDANKTLMNMMMKKKEDGSATPRTPHSYNNPTFISKPTTPRDWSAGAHDRPRPRTDHDWERMLVGYMTQNLCPLKIATAIN